VAGHVKGQDIVITTALIPGRPAPTLITKEMVESMKPGSVIVDLAVERGGNCPLSKPDQIVEHKGVKIIGTVNLAGKLAGNAAPLFAKNIANFLDLMIQKDGALKIDEADECISGTLIAKGGKLVHKMLRGQVMEQIAHRLTLCFAARHFRAGGVCRLLCGVERHTRAAHAADEVTNAISSVIVVGALLAVGAGAIASGSITRHDLRLPRAGAGLHQHFRWLHGHLAHARHVQEERQVR
jgi:NAD/NADP transhydrogenase alpha subunit